MDYSITVDGKKITFDYIAKQDKYKNLSPSEKMKVKDAFFNLSMKQKGAKVEYLPKELRTKFYQETSKYDIGDFEGVKPKKSIIERAKEATGYNVAKEVLKKDIVPKYKPTLNVLEAVKDIAKRHAEGQKKTIERLSAIPETQRKIGEKIQEISEKAGEIPYKPPIAALPAATSGAFPVIGKLAGWYVKETPPIMLAADIATLGEGAVARKALKRMAEKKMGSEIAEMGIETAEKVGAEAVESKIPKSVEIKKDISSLTQRKKDINSALKSIDGDIERYKKILENPADNPMALAVREEARNKVEQLIPQKMKLTEELGKVRGEIVKNRFNLENTLKKEKIEKLKSSTNLQEQLEGAWLEAEEKQNRIFTLEELEENFREIAEVNRKRLSSPAYKNLPEEKKAIYKQNLNWAENELNKIKKEKNYLTYDKKFQDPTSPEIPRNIKKYEEAKATLIDKKIEANKSIAMELKTGAKSSEDVVKNLKSEADNLAKGSTTKQLKLEAEQLAKGQKIIKRIKENTQAKKLAGGTIKERIMKSVLDPFYRIKYLSKGGKRLERGVSETYSEAVSMGSRASEKTIHHTETPLRELGNTLKDQNELSIFDRIYSLKSFIEGADHINIDGRKLSDIARENLDYLRASMIKNGRKEALERIEKAVDDFADRTNDILIKIKKDGGLITEEAAKNYKKKYRYYMSYQYSSEVTAQMLDNEPLSFDRLALGFTKSREGAISLPDMNPTELFTKSVYRSHLAAEKKKLIDLSIREFGLTEIPQSKARELGLLQYNFGGKSYYVPQEVYEFLKRADTHTVDLFHKFSSNISKFFKSGVLELNIGYYRSMVMRDLYEYSVRGRGYWTPIDKKLFEGLAKLVNKMPFPFLKKIFRPNPYADMAYLFSPKIWIKALSESFSYRFSKKGSKLIEQLAREGYFIRSEAEIYERLSRLEFPRGRMEKASMKLKRSLTSVMKAWDDTIRLANTLRNVDTKGKSLMKLEEIAPDMWKVSPHEWKELSRSIFIDFEKIGEGLKTINYVMPFTNAKVQDIYETMRFAKENPMLFTFRAGALLSAVSGLYIKMKKDGTAENVSPVVTDQYGMVDTGFRYKVGNKEYPLVQRIIKIPDALQPLWIPLKKSIDIMFEKNVLLKEELKKTFLADNLTKGIGSYVSLGGPIVGVAELMMNKDLFYNREIKPKSNAPNYLIARKGTGNTYRLMAQIIDKVLPEGFNNLKPSPEQIKHFGRQTFGEVPNILDQMFSRRIRKLVEAPQPYSERLPFGLRFSTTLLGTKIGKYQPEYSESKTIMGIIRGDYNKAYAIGKNAIDDILASPKGSEERKIAQKRLSEVIKTYRNRKELTDALNKYLRQKIKREHQTPIEKVVPKKYIPEVLRRMGKTNPQ